MRNFTSILTFLAISTSLVSSRAVSGDKQTLVARAPYSTGRYLTSQFFSSTKVPCHSSPYRSSTNDPLANTTAPGANITDTVATNLTDVATGNITDTAPANLTDKAISGRYAPLRRSDVIVKSRSPSLEKNLADINVNKLKLKTVPTLEPGKKNHANSTTTAGAAKASTSATAGKAAKKAAKAAKKAAKVILYS